MFESPNRKKMNGQSSPNIYNHQAQSRFKPQFMNNSELRVEETSQHLLRGSCSNLFKKFEPKNDHQTISTNNLGASLRNTTHFNPINKFPTHNAEIKKPFEDSNPFKNSNASKIMSQDPPNHSFLKPIEKPRGNNQ